MFHDGVIGFDIAEKPPPASFYGGFGKSRIGGDFFDQSITRIICNGDGGKDDLLFPLSGAFEFYNGKGLKEQIFFFFT